MITLFNQIFRNGVLVLISSFFLGISFSPAFCSVDDQVERIQKAYENMQDVSGSFSQQSYIKDLKQTQTFSGRFYIRKPMKMKWKYEGDQPQEVLIGNDRITIYQKKEKQAFRSRFDRETYGQAPIALLSGFGQVREEFTITEKSGRLLLKPKRPMGGIVSVELETSGEGFPIQSFTVHDSLSNRVKMTLKEVKVNTGLKESVFTLSIPKDAKILEY